MIPRTTETNQTCLYEKAVQRIHFLDERAGVFMAHGPRECHTTGCRLPSPTRTGRGAWRGGDAGTREGACSSERCRRATLTQVSLC